MKQKIKRIISGKKLTIILKGGTLMKIRKLFALMLALCLALSCAPGLAAPTRDTKAVEVTMDEKLLSLTELVVNAAILQVTPAEPGKTVSIPGLEKGETPSDLLVASVMAWGTSAGTLPYAKEITDQETVPLRVSAANSLYARVFTNGAYAFKENQTAEEIQQVKADNKMRTWYAGDELNVAYAKQCKYGAYIYSAEFDGTDVSVLCDVYAVTDAADQQSAENVPEDQLTWLYNAEISLCYNPEKAFGYTLNSFSFSPVYQDGDLSKWTETENTEYEYSLNVPSTLGVADDSAAHRVWQSADGKVSLTVEAQKGAVAYDDALSKFLVAHPGIKLLQERDFCRFSAINEGSFVMMYASEELPWTYTITFTFPAERQAEYELYAEIIRNALSIWGISNG